MAARIQDLRGRRYGNLVVLEKTGQKEDRYYTWLCQCDCGNKVIVNTKHLNRGTISDCGCKKIRKPGPKAMDLTGQRFGKLTAVRRVENGTRRRARWLCKCDCGNEKVIAAQELRAGKTKSCGCILKNSHTTMKNLRGMQIGRLTVIKPTEERDCKGSIKWVCHCSCGNEILLSADILRFGSYRSCGCLRIEKAKKLQSYMSFIDGTCIEWLEGRRNRSDNSSGHIGVYITKRGTYKASITLSGNRYHLGTYTTFDEAVRAREYAEDVLHGGFISEYASWKSMAVENPEWAKENPFHYEVSKETLRYRI